MKIILILMFLVNNAVAMERWRALAMLESGGDDQIVGRVGEVSRYQIRPELWQGGNPRNMAVALTNAICIMNERINIFKKTHGRSPTDYEFYILWNAPAQINHPHRVVRERARRFVNLIGSSDT